MRTDRWNTPSDIFNILDLEFHFDLDPCCDNDNHLTKFYFTELEDGLCQSWQGHSVFCNPPYKRGVLKKWIEKAVSEIMLGDCLVVLLLPASVGSKWFHDYLYGNCEIRFIKGRLSFSNKGRAPFDSMICILRGVKYGL